MRDSRALLDAFADARRSWDDLITLQPDIYAGGGHSEQLDLRELAERVKIHQEAVDVLAVALDTELSDEESPRENTAPPSGISNRQSPREEADDRRRHPPLATDSPPPQDASGRVGEQPLEDTRNRHTSHKAGSRSIAQKESRSRYPDRSAPPSRKVAGAFGREPKE